MTPAPTPKPRPKPAKPAQKPKPKERPGFTLALYLLVLLAMAGCHLQCAVQVSPSVFCDAGVCAPCTEAQHLNELRQCGIEEGN